jgi:lipoyl(octanoyl) transferase
MTSFIQCIDLKIIDYKEAYTIQTVIFQKCHEEKILDTIIFQENKPVFSLGRGSLQEHLLKNEAELLDLGIDLVYADRGGDVSYHGPGQLVISPVLHLKRYTNSVHQYVRDLEEVVIRLLKKHQIEGHRIEGLSGVWVGIEKIAAIGIAVQHGITRHGVSINVNPDLTHYDYIIACGLKDRKVTSLEKLGIHITDISQIRDDFITEFNQVFDTVANQTEFNERRLLNES